MTVKTQIEELKARAIWAGEIQPRLDARYIIKGWLSRAAMSVLYGASCSGKTFLALDMAQSIAKGIPWHGVRVHGDPVLYIAAEGQEGFLNRVAALDGRSGMKLLILPCPVDLCRDRRGGEVIAELLKSMATDYGEFAAVFIDTLARSIGDGDENSGADMGAFISNVDVIRRATGAHICVIHHTGKDVAKGARGHSSLRAATDTEIEVTTEKEISTARVKKHRDGKIPLPFSYILREVELGTDEDGDPVTTCLVEPCQTPQKEASLAPSQRAVFQALLEFSASHGRPDPEITDRPECVAALSVSADEFLKFAAKKMHQPTPKQRNQHVKRVCYKLVEKGYIGIHAGRISVNPPQRPFGHKQSQCDLRDLGAFGRAKVTRSPRSPFPKER